MSGDHTGIRSQGKVDLIIRPEIYESMIRHCHQESPLECCGILAGRDSRAWSIYPLPNACQSETRYNADPQALIRAVQAMRREQTEIMAIYHSHPKWPAVPSQTDLRENHYGEVPRIIIGLLKSPPECRVWRFYTDPYRYTELAWSIAHFDIHQSIANPHRS
jgi:proteasome lid subunit RPN8/RPN11